MENQQHQGSNHNGQAQQAAAPPSSPSSSTNSVEHALLESLFYNEMLTMEGNSLSPDFMSFLSNDLDVSDGSNPDTAAVADASAIAEKAMLRDFGVVPQESSSAATTAAPQPSFRLPATSQIPDSKLTLGTPSYSTRQPLHVAESRHATFSLHNNQHLPVQTQQHRQQEILQKPAPMSSSSSLETTPPLQPVPSHTLSVPQSPNRVSAQLPLLNGKKKKPGIHHNVVANPVARRKSPNTTRATINGSTVPLVRQNSNHIPPTTSAPPPIPQAAVATATDADEKLVHQFTSLAGKLGISLPSNILKTLTEKASPLANNNNGKHHPPTIEATAMPAAATTATNPVQSLPTTSPPTMTNGHHVWESATINNDGGGKKRPHVDITTAFGTATATTKPSPSSSGGGRRRKKPRLQDCEKKLAALKAENETLKRHLEIIHNKTKRFQQERKQQEEQMKHLVTSGNADPAKLMPLLEKFKESYADYGRHRNQELFFHLDQLQRLIAPTNFTKMGLWTLGQHEKFYTDLKRNPIAGILRQELGITPQQGRKILEQRQRIRDVSDNLKHCLELLGKLKTLCQHKQKVFSDRITKCQEILTPIQVVKLLIWVNEHSNILQSICPGWANVQQVDAAAAAKKGATNSNA